MKITTPAEAQNPPRYKISALNPASVDRPWVTLVSCGAIMEADFVRSRLESEDIPVFVPDENLMSAAAWALNTYGYIRVQVAPTDYEKARELLIASGDAVGEN